MRGLAVLSSVTLLMASVFVIGGCPDTTDTPLDASVVDGATEVGPSPPADAGLAWRIVLDKLDGALLSIWGASDNDVWTVGGPLGNAGYDALVLRFDGKTWKRALVPANANEAGIPKSYWWVHGSSATDVWMVGEGGRITHWDGAAFKEFDSGTAATLFGVWAASPTDAWAVGGTPDQPNAPNDVVLHWDGASWKSEAVPELNKAALFKVWGSSSDDLYVVGELGVIWHRKNGTWTREGVGVATGRLTTVAGCSASEIYAVGSRDILVSDGTTWSKAPGIDPLKVLNDVNGVSCSPDGQQNVVIVGGGSLKLRYVRANKTWESDFGSEPFTDLHGAWVDRSGAFWGVGGQFAAAARPNTSRQGVVGRFASNLISTTIAP